MERGYCVHCMNPMDGDRCNVCGKSAAEYRPAPHHLQAGTMLNGKYLVGAVLGEGGFGITYIGRDTNLDIKVAIKEYYPSGSVSRNTVGSREITAHVGEAQAFFERGKRSFLEEARVLAKFSGQSSVVSVRDFFSENNTVYIVMEYLEGIDLKDYLNRHGKMTFEETVAMLAPIMNALSKIHAHGLIHRDISPANIMLLNDGTVKLLDFGAAREVGGADEKSLSILLKPGYAPEEQYRTKGRQGPWTDVYALSATMYKMLTGETPTDAMNRVFSDDLGSIRERNPSVTAEQEAVIRKGMAVQQANRYQTIDALYADCRAAASAGQQTEKTVRTIAGGGSRTYYEPADEKTVKTVVGGGSRTHYEPTDERTVADSGNRRGVQAQPQGRAEEAGCGKKTKKPSIPAFIGSIITGALTLYAIFAVAISILEKQSGVALPIILALLLGAATFFLGRLYFPRIDNKNRKPNVFCFAASIVSLLATIYYAISTYFAFENPSFDNENLGTFGVVMTALSLALPIFFGYFYFPRLNRKKKKLFMKIFGGIAAAAVLGLVIGILFKNVNTVTIGDQNIARDATEVTLTLDIVTNHEIEKLKELKKLESLSVYECFLDDEDIKTIGELTQLKKLSIFGNTDVTDISPLAKLTELTYLDISITKVSDLSCISGLTKLETLSISNTKVSDLSVLKNFTALDTLKMDYLSELEPSTLVLPATVSTLYCCGNGLQSLDFVTGSESLRMICASDNEISDLSPLAKFKLYKVDLALNHITDLSALDVSEIYDLDVSTNEISDISCLNGINASMIDLSYNNITDISALADSYRIGKLALQHNQITDISPLKDCYKIWSLDISYNQIVDISAVATIDDMAFFNARSNKIADISPLASCTKLIESNNSLDLRNNCITSVEALSAYTNTRHIYLSGNQITDVSPLKNCTALEMLCLNHNRIEDVSALGALPQLSNLQLVDNPITSVDALRLDGYENTIFGFSNLHISYHESIDFAKLAEIEHLKVMVYDVPPRQQEALRKYGFWVSIDSGDELDEEESNPDLTEAENTEEESDG